MDQKHSKTFEAEGGKTHFLVEWSPQQYQDIRAKYQRMFLRTFRNIPKTGPKYREDADRNTEWYVLRSFS